MKRMIECILSINATTGGRKSDKKQSGGKERSKSMKEMRLSIDKEKLELISKKNGSEVQCVKLMEEMAKLQQEVCNWLFHKFGSSEYRIAEECAGVLVLIGQIQLLLNIPDQVLNMMMDDKVNREVRHIELDGEKKCG